MRPCTKSAHTVVNVSQPCVRTVRADTVRADTGPGRTATRLRSAFSEHLSP